MNVHFFVGFQFTQDFVPRYVVPTIVVVSTAILLGSWVCEHLRILRKQKAQASQQEKNTVESAQADLNPAELVPDEVAEFSELVVSEKTPAESVLDENMPVELPQSEMVGKSVGAYPRFFMNHAHDTSRLRINTEVIHQLVGEDLKRVTEDERWFVEWYYAERKRGITHWSTFGTLKSPDAPQDQVCKELRAILTTLTTGDSDLH